jgi:hypothetical protein
MSTTMGRLPASATAGDRQQVQNLPEDDSANSSNDSLLEGKQQLQEKDDTDTATYRHGPSGEGDQGWSDGFSFNGGPDWIRCVMVSSQTSILRLTPALNIPASLLYLYLVIDDYRQLLSLHFLCFFQSRCQSSSLLGE